MGLVVVAFSGRSGVGKDTAANELVNQWGFVPLGLADPVKDTIDRVSGRTRELHKELDAAGVPLRMAWQLLGTEAREAVGNIDLWTQVDLVTIYYLHKLHPSPRDRFVVPDMRYPHEHRLLKTTVVEWGGMFVSIQIVRKDAASLGVIGGHSSETEIDKIPWNVRLANDGDRDEFRFNARSIVEAYLNGFAIPADDPPDLDSI